MIDGAEGGKNEIEPMSDYEIALMDSIRTIIEVLIAKEIVRPEVLDKMLHKQSEAYSETDMPGALFVMREIRRTLTDPERSQLRSLLGKPTEGTA